MRVDEQLVNLKMELERIKVKKVQIQEQLRFLEQEKQNILQECAQLGVNPQEIEATILQREQILQQQIQLLSSQLASCYDTK